MNYYETFFGKIPFIMHSGGFHSGKHFWLHSYVKIQGGLVPMNKKNPDGSYSVLGVEFTIVPNISFGNKNKAQMQNSLQLHADKLREMGIEIVKQTKNTLIARNGKETAVYSISPLSMETFYKKL